MNRILIFVLGLLLGGIIIYVLGDFFPRIVIQNTTIKRDSIVRVDTVHKLIQVKPKAQDKEQVEIKESSEEVLVLELDSLRPDLSNVEPDSGYKIVRDRQLGKRTVVIQYLPNFTDTNAVAKLNSKFSEENSFVSPISVEFWESAIDFMGYKLSKTKLILFGISPQEHINLLFESPESLIILVDDKKFSLTKTEKYKSITF